MGFYWVLNVFSLPFPYLLHYGADTELSTENVFFKRANNVSSNRLLQELKLCIHRDKSIVDRNIRTDVLIKEKQSWVTCPTADDSRNGNVPGLSCCS